MKLHIIPVLFSLSAILIGCANDVPLGSHVANLKAQQTYNPNATEENLGVVPSGSGERMEGTYQVYTGKEVDSLTGSGESQVLQGVN